MALANSIFESSAVGINSHRNCDRYVHVVIFELYLIGPIQLPGGNFIKLNISYQHSFVICMFQNEN